MAAGRYWRCPLCERRVPEKVVECYCGRVRQPGDGPDRQAPGRPFPTAATALGTALLASALLAFWVTRPREGTGKAPSRGGQDASSRAPLPVVEEIQPESRRRRSVSNTAPTTTLSDSARAYDVATRHVRHRLTGLSARLDAFDKSCGAGSRQSSCLTLRDQIVREAQDIRSSLDAAEERARRAFLDGGTVMELRERNGVMEGDVRAVLARAPAGEGR